MTAFSPQLTAISNLLGKSSNDEDIDANDINNILSCKKSKCYFTLKLPSLPFLICSSRIPQPTSHRFVFSSSVAIVILIVFQSQL